MSKVGHRLKVNCFQDGKLMDQTDGYVDTNRRESAALLTGPAALTGMKFGWIRGVFVRQTRSSIMTLECTKCFFCCADKMSPEYLGSPAVHAVVMGCRPSRVRYVSRSLVTHNWRHFWAAIEVTDREFPGRICDGTDAGPHIQEDGRHIWFCHRYY